jgi:hypothetical protein
LVERNTIILLIVLQFNFFQNKQNGGNAELNTNKIIVEETKLLYKIQTKHQILAGI